MSPSQDLSNSLARVHELVGRNVFAFQRLERLLKHILTYSNVSFVDGTMAEAFAQREKKTKIKTLGTLKKDLFKSTIMPVKEEAVEEINSLEKEGVSIRMTYCMPEEAHQIWKARFEALVLDRNDMVHTSLQKWDLRTIDGCALAMSQLNEQHEKTLIETEEATRLSEGIFKTIGLFRNKLIVPEG